MIRSDIFKKNDTYSNEKRKRKNEKKERKPIFSRWSFRSFDERRSIDFSNFHLLKKHCPEKVNQLDSNWHGVSFDDGLSRKFEQNRRQVGQQPINRPLFPSLSTNCSFAPFFWVGSFYARAQDCLDREYCRVNLEKKKKINKRCKICRHKNFQNL